jgi:hypothetical protein
VRLSEAIEVLARRLGINRGRVATIANRLQHAGFLPLPDARRTPPDLSADQISSLLLGVLVERGVESAANRFRDYGSMTSPEGYRLGETMTAIIRGQAQPGDMIVREGGVSATVNGQHAVFGKPAEDGTARFCTGPTLAAIAAELQGASPTQADAFAAITRIRNGH